MRSLLLALVLPALALGCSGPRSTPDRDPPKTTEKKPEVQAAEEQPPAESPEAGISLVPAPGLPSDVEARVLAFSPVDGRCDIDVVELPSGVKKNAIRMPFPCRPADNVAFHPVEPRLLLGGEGRYFEADLATGSVHELPAAPSAKAWVLDYDSNGAIRLLAWDRQDPSFSHGSAAFVLNGRRYEVDRALANFAAFSGLGRVLFLVNGRWIDQPGEVAYGREGQGYAAALLAMKAAKNFAAHWRDPSAMPSVQSTTIDDPATLRELFAFRPTGSAPVFWQLSSAPFSWAFTSETDSGDRPHGPVVVYTTEGWTELPGIAQLATPSATSLQGEASLRLERNGPWLLAGGSGGAAAYDLSNQQERWKAVGGVATFWPSELPLPDLDALHAQAGPSAQPPGAKPPPPDEAAAAIQAPTPPDTTPTEAPPTPVWPPRVYGFGYPAPAPTVPPTGPTPQAGGQPSTPPAPLPVKPQRRGGEEGEHEQDPE